MMRVDGLAAGMVLSVVVASSPANAFDLGGLLPGGGGGACEAKGLIEGALGAIGSIVGGAQGEAAGRSAGREIESARDAAAPEGGCPIIESTPNAVEEELYDHGDLLRQALRTGNAEEVLALVARMQPAASVAEENVGALGRDPAGVYPLTLSALPDVRLTTDDWARRHYEAVLRAREIEVERLETAAELRAAAERLSQASRSSEGIVEAQQMGNQAQGLLVAALADEAVASSAREVVRHEEALRAHGERAIAREMHCRAWRDVAPGLCSGQMPSIQGW